MTSESSESEDMASVLVPRILKNAIQTFTCNKELFTKNLDHLANLFNNLTARHVNLNPVFMKEDTWAPRNKAPMSYVHIYSDEIINVGIFILKPNMKLPLHNHPEMHGLLKVIAGSVNIKSYSLNTDRTVNYNQDSDSNGEGPLQFVVEKKDDIRINSEAECCRLSPNTGNLHEIESVDGPAAFIDILSPPYDVDIPNVGERKCSYFRIEKELDPGIFVVTEINTPKWFWSDSFPYTGPRFDLQEE